MSRIQITKMDPVVREAKYSFIPLTYTDKGKTFTRKIVSFSPVYEAISAAVAGDTFEVDVKKNANGIYEWMSAVKVDASAALPSAGTTGKSGNWETTEERARRQVLIVRQSCLAQAVALANTRFGTDMLDVLQTAAQFEAWVTRE